MAAIEPVNSANKDEDCKSNDEEIDDVLKKVSISDMGGRIEPKDIGNVDGEGREVEATSEKASNWHNNVIN